MGNTQSSQKIHDIREIPDISLKVGFNTHLAIWIVIFCVGSVEFNNPFDVLHFPSGQHPVGLEIIPHTKIKEIKKIRIIFENGSTSCGWIYMDDANPQSFQVLPVARTGRRLGNHPTKFYFCDQIDGTTEWIITIFEVRDVDGNLATPEYGQYAMFSVGCRITDRIELDTGSISIPELEYVAASNEIRQIRQIQRIELETIYQIMNHILQPPIIQTNRFINE